MAHDAAYGVWCWFDTCWMWHKSGPRYALHMVCWTGPGHVLYAIPVLNQPCMQDSGLVQIEPTHHACWIQHTGLVHCRHCMCHVPGTGLPGASVFCMQHVEIESGHVLHADTGPHWLWCTGPVCRPELALSHPLAYEA